MKAIEALTVINVLTTIAEFYPCHVKRDFSFRLDFHWLRALMCLFLE